MARIPGYYPDWLPTDLIWGDLPWESSIKASPPAFFEQYTLHDSNWITLRVDPEYDGSAIAVIRWDTFWTDSRVPFPGSAVAEWPILHIGFTNVSAVNLVGYHADAPTPRGIAGARSEILKRSAASNLIIYRTCIEDHFGGVVEVIHESAARFLCLDRTRRALAIPDIPAET